jgi:hypothetical protein
MREAIESKMLPYLTMDNYLKVLHTFSVNNLRIGTILVEDIYKQLEKPLPIISIAKKNLKIPNKFRFQ